MCYKITEVMMTDFFSIESSDDLLLACWYSSLNQSDMKCSNDAGDIQGQ